MRFTPIGQRLSGALQCVFQRIWCLSCYFFSNKGSKLLVPCRPNTGSSSTFAVVGEVEQQGLKAAGAGPEQVPDDLAEQHHRHIVLHLKTARKSTAVHSIFLKHTSASSLHCTQRQCSQGTYKYLINFFFFFNDHSWSHCCSPALIKIMG